MEIIIGLIVLVAVGYFTFFRKKDEPVVVEAVPYKVETPAPVAEVVEAPAPIVIEAAPAKAPRKPRAPKAEVAVKKPVAKAKEKAPAKAKAPKVVAKAPAKKPAAIKAKSKKA